MELRMTDTEGRNYTDLEEAQNFLGIGSNRMHDLIKQGRVATSPWAKTMVLITDVEDYAAARKKRVSKDSLLEGYRTILGRLRHMAEGVDDGEGPLCGCDVCILLRNAESEG